MITNELIFLVYLSLICSALLIALKIGVEALCTVITVQWILANLFVTKSITLFSLDATASDALAVGALLGFNLIQEYFGREKARLSIIINFFGLIFYTATSYLHLLYIPAQADQMHAHFSALLSPMPRILLASVSVYLIVQYLDYMLYNSLKRRLQSRFFIVRNYISISVTQAVDTVLFSFLALYGTVENLGHIMVISYSIKLITILLSTPFLALSRVIMQKRDDHVQV